MKPYQVSLRNASDATINTSTFRWDGQLAGIVPIKGDLTIFTKSDGTNNILISAGYDTFGNVTSLNDPRLGQTQAGYDASGVYLTSITNAALHRTDYIYFGVNEKLIPCQSKPTLWLSESDPRSQYQLCYLYQFGYAYGVHSNCI